MGFSLRDAIEKSKRDKVTERVENLTPKPPVVITIIPEAKTEVQEQITTIVEAPKKTKTLLGSLRKTPEVPGPSNPIPSVPVLTKPSVPVAPIKMIVNGEPVVIADPVLQEIKANIAFINDNIEEVGLVGQAVRKTMEQMRRNPHFRSFLTATDKETIVRGYMRAFNVAARKKTDGQEKRGKKAASVDEIDRMMNDMDLGDVQF